MGVERCQNAGSPRVLGVRAPWPALRLAAQSPAANLIDFMCGSAQDGAKSLHTIGGSKAHSQNKKGCLQ
jgi:hypothetical protein